MRSSESNEFKDFEELTKKLLRVPRDEVKKAEEEAKKERDEKKRTKPKKATS